MSDLFGNVPDLTTVLAKLDALAGVVRTLSDQMGALLARLDEQAKTNEVLEQGAHAARGDAERSRIAAEAAWDRVKGATEPPPHMNGTGE